MHPSIAASIRDLHCLTLDLVDLENEFADAIQDIAAQDSENIRADAAAVKNSRDLQPFRNRMTAIVREIEKVQALIDQVDFEISSFYKWKEGFCIADLSRANCKYE
jgi:hypothetical protein